MPSAPSASGTDLLQDSWSREALFRAGDGEPDSLEGKSILRRMLKYRRARHFAYILLAVVQVSKGITRRGSS